MYAELESFHYAEAFLELLSSCDDNVEIKELSDVNSALGHLGFGE
ncbi:hypothetical protein STRIC_1604 [Streptococcus ictaluri 707-05]|uniref:Uncharacterized protein n=1 Tax=Streptococcus ictaluri 707-05 TaxID=764299 RepID=G5K484_9STRE|nr:hypothetical protein STRIC_1604 [Streptococcus ictaluri 707-05]